MRISPSPCPLCHSGVALLVLLVLSIGSSSATSSGETTSPAPVTERLLVTDGGILHLRRKLHESNQTGSNSGPLTSLDSIRAFRTKQKDVGSYGLNTAYAVSPGGYGGPQGPIPAGFPLFGGPTIDDSQTPVGYSGTDSSVGSAQAWVDYSPSAAPSCVDTHHKCGYLVSNGKCNGHFGFVAQLCPLSCGVCELMTHGLNHSPSSNGGYQQPASFPETPYVATPPPVPTEPPPPVYPQPSSYGSQPAAPSSYGSSPSPSSSYGSQPAAIPAAPSYISAPSGPSYSQPSSFSGPIPAGQTYVPQATYSGPITAGNAYVPQQTFSGAITSGNAYVPQQQFSGPIGIGNAYVPLAPKGPIASGTAYAPQPSYSGPIASGSAQVPINSYSGGLISGQAVVPQQSYGGSINPGIAVVPSQVYSPRANYPQQPSYGQPSQPYRDAPSANLVSPPQFHANETTRADTTTTTTTAVTTSSPTTTIAPATTTTTMTTPVTITNEKTTIGSQKSTFPISNRTVEVAPARIQPLQFANPAYSQPRKNPQLIPESSRSSVQKSSNIWARPLPPAVQNPSANYWNSQPPGFQKSQLSPRSRSPSAQPQPVPIQKGPKPPVVTRDFGVRIGPQSNTVGSRWGQWSSWGICVDKQRFRSRNCNYDESLIGSSGCVGNSYESTPCTIAIKG